MQVRKYKAANTREALEKINQELGADAYLLDVKQVSKNIFGFGAEMQVEVTAAVPENEKLANESLFGKLITTGLSFLRLTNNASAASDLHSKSARSLNSTRF